MHPYWDCFTEPILSCLHPRAIVEIGSEAGKTTQVLLAFCQKHEATLHAIDPVPTFDVAAWQEKYGTRFVFHRSVSIAALPTIAHYDVVLIDGDHNWYTVFHELKLIEKRSVTTSQPFPLVLLHDVGWPYGRRDLYYNPASIPDAYRHPYERKGLRHGTETLQKQGGINARLCHATTENTPRNGVLTAVEDFLTETPLALEWLFVPGFHGLGILYPAELKQENRSFAEILETWALPAPLKQYIERLEAARLTLSTALWDRDYDRRMRETEWQQKYRQLNAEKQRLSIALQSTVAELEKARHPIRNRPETTHPGSSEDP
ncbi:MAG: class I SAM-dependent methyltransferase [Rhodothermales bacterium]